MCPLALYYWLFYRYKNKLFSYIFLFAGTDEFALVDHIMDEGGGKQVRLSQ